MEDSELPKNWEDEASRIASEFETTIGTLGEGVSRYEKKRGAHKNLTEIRESIRGARAELDNLREADPDDVSDLVLVVLASRIRRRKSIVIVDKQQVGRWLANLDRLRGMLGQLEKDFDAALADLSTKLPGGHQGDLPRRFLIFKCANAYAILADCLPGRSSTHAGPFGDFVEAVRLKVREDLRPKGRLSASQIHYVLKGWYRSNAELRQRQGGSGAA